MLNIALYKAPLVWIGIFGIFALCEKLHQSRNSTPMIDHLTSRAAAAAATYTRAMSPVAPKSPRPPPPALTIDNCQAYKRNTRGRTGVKDSRGVQVSI